MIDTVWIASGGGPLLLMHHSLLSAWRGVSGRAEGAGAYTSDYDRACAVEDEIAVLEGSPHILVLGDEPDATSIRAGTAASFIVRWRAAPSVSQMEAAVARHINQLPFERVGQFTTVPGEHVLFDSAFAGPDAKAVTVTTLDGTSYDLATAMLTDADGVSALVHRLSRVV